MTDLEVQCWRQWEGEGGLDCGLLPWVMVSDERSPQCTVQTECCRGGYIICWILLLFGIFENPERTIIKYIPCPWGLALLVPRTSGQNPPLRAGECRLPHCLNIAVVSSAAEARCCQTSDDRRQEQSPETGPLATQGTPTVWGTGGPGLFI